MTAFLTLSVWTSEKIDKNYENFRRSQYCFSNLNNIEIQILIEKKCIVKTSYNTMLC